MKNKLLMVFALFLGFSFFKVNGSAVECADDFIENMVFWASTPSEGAVAGLRDLFARHPRYFIALVADETFSQELIDAIDSTAKHHPDNRSLISKIRKKAFILSAKAFAGRDENGVNELLDKLKKNLDSSECKGLLSQAFEWRVKYNYCNLIRGVLYPGQEV